MAGLPEFTLGSGTHLRHPTFKIRRSSTTLPGSLDCGVTTIIKKCQYSICLL